MTELGKYFYKVSAALLATGGVCGGVGIKGVIRFLNDIGVYRTMSVKQYALNILFPHILLLAGVAFIAFGILMLVKGIRFNRDHSSNTTGMEK